MSCTLRPFLVRVVLAMTLGMVSLTAFGQQALEIFSLRHRTADQIVPVLRSLVEPAGSVSALNDKLVVRATPAALAQVRQALMALDTPLRRLEISVRQDDASSSGTSRAGVDGGRVVIGPDGAVVGARGGFEASSGRRAENVLQRIQTVEGGQASIFVGRSLPLPMRQLSAGRNGVVVSDSVVFVDVGNGFTVRPEVVGDTVSLTIRPVASRTTTSGIEGSSLSTTLNGRLGEWLSLGSSNQSGTSGMRGTISYGAGEATRTASYAIRVDVLD